LHAVTAVFLDDPQADKQKSKRNAYGQRAAACALSGNCNGLHTPVDSQPVGGGDHMVPLLSNRHEKGIIFLSLTRIALFRAERIGKFAQKTVKEL